MTHTFETQANTCMLPAHSGSSLLNTSCSNSSSCTCFSTLSNHLCALQVTSPTSRQTRAIDILLIQSQRIIPSITSLFDCQYCMKETQSLFLVSMILSRLLRWSQVSIHAHGSRCVPAQVHLGRYHTSSEFGATVTRMLIQTHCMCLKTTVEAFQHEVGRIGCEDAERAYLTLQARNFQQEFEKLIEELPNVPSAIPG
jgi:hypothetical protein